MFEYLRLQNFQSHRDTFLEFHKNVNVIFGTSLNGKTAIARGMGLLIYNRPLGCRYYSNFAPNKGETTIQLKPLDGPVITLEKTVHRKKDESKELVKTTYTYNNQNFSNLSDVIESTLNISELNIQQQFDNPFLILSSGGEFARVVNKITKLEKVDVWVSEFKSKINKTKNEIDFLESQITTCQNILTKYQGFEDLSTEINLLKEKNAELNNTNNKLLKLDGLLEKIEGIDDELARLTPALRIEPDIESLSQIEQAMVSIEKRVVLINKVRTIHNGISALNTIMGQLRQLEQMFLIEDQLQKIDYTLSRIEKAEDQIQEGKKLLELLSRLETLKVEEQGLASLGRLVQRIKDLSTSIEDEKQKYEDCDKELAMILKNVKECPLFLLPCLCVEKMMEKLK